MRKFITGSATAALLALPLCGVAQAKSASPSHIHTYTRLYQKVSTKFGARTPGRNIVRWGDIHHRKASDAEVVKSITVLHRMLAPPPVVHTVAYTTTPVPTPVTTPNPTVPATTYSASAPSTAPSGLVGCIVRSESGGNATVVNSSGHMGLGQWAESTWIADGGGKYSQTPLGASYSQQLSIIQSQVAAGNTGQWTNYDGC